MLNINIKLLFSFNSLFAYLNEFHDPLLLTLLIHGGGVLPNVNQTLGGSGGSRDSHA